MQGKQKTMVKKNSGCLYDRPFIMPDGISGDREALHEWIGIAMTLLVILHQVLNRKWYGGLFKGKYNAHRIIITVIDIVLLISFAVTAVCGMAMSGHAVPFMYGMVQVSFARRMHLSMSHWAFVLMGLHLGLHIPVMFAGIKLTDRVKIALSGVFCLIAGVGLVFFLKNGMPDYLLFRVPFAFLDYEKAGILVFLENILTLSFWAFIGVQIVTICRNAKKTADEKKNPKDSQARIPVHYSGGATLSEDIQKWLDINRINR